MEALGQRHVGHGVRPEHYETVGQAFLWAIGQALDRGFYPAVRTAWTAPITTVAERMKEGSKKLPAA